MQRLPIKPLSINAAYSGKRRKTKSCNKYVMDVIRLLPAGKAPEGLLSLEIEWGFSSKGSDIDNCAKVFIDCLQKKYGFNDNRVYRLLMTKMIVPKGDEYIQFELTTEK